jgi:LysR family hydrogen peroxide-inducible transcriptional activator
MAITLRQLRYFTALAEARHFGRAADLCHVSQPALSVQIRELETALGLVLIDRQPRDAVLTRAGREVLRRAQRVLDEVAGLEAAAQRETGLTAPLHLGLIPTVAPYLLPGVLARLRAGDITMDIRVREAQTSALLADLADGTLDAAVVALPGPAGLSERLLFEDRFLLAGSAAGLAAGEGAESLRPTGLDPDRLMLLDEGHCLADQALEVCGLTRNARIHLGASSLATLAGLAAQGFGLTFLPEIAVPTETAAAPDLALRRFAAPEPARRIGLVCRRETAAQDWVAGLTEVLAETGRGLIARARGAPG